MTFTLLLRRSSTPGHAPTTSQLSLGELSVNTNDGILYFMQQNSTTLANTIIAISNTPQTANALTTARTIALSGDATGSVSFDGSANVTIATTLASTAVTAGSYGSGSQIATFTVDSKGRITAAANTAISVTGLLGYTPLNAANASVTATGDATGTASFAGSNNVSVALTLASVGTAGTYSSVTTDSKGRVIAGTNITVSGDATGTVNAAAGLPLTLATTGVSAGAYGSNTQVATFTVDAKGRLTAATSVAINVVSALGYTPVNNAIVGQANGIATLDATGHLTISQLPTSITGAFVYQGTWDAFLNSPALANGVGTKGYVYKVSNAGTTNLQGTTQWNVGDEVVFDGTTWDKIDGLGNEVISVAGRTGVVTLSVSDVTGVAPLASPALTGTPTAPTALLTDNSTTIATTAFIKGQNYMVAPLVASGDVSGTASGNTVTLTLQNVATAGTYGSASQIPAITINAKGLVTSITNTAISVTGLLGYTPLNSANATVILNGDTTGTATFVGNVVNVTTTLATVNTNVGSFGGATVVPAITVNGKGLVTAVTATNIAFPVTTVFGRTGAVVLLSSDVTGALGYVPQGNAIVVTGDVSGTSTQNALTLTLANVNTNVGSFGGASTVATFTVNAKGLVTAASNVAINVVGALGYTPLNSANATVTLTGDATGSATFSGNAVSVATTLKNTGSVGTYTAVVTDAQGRVATGLNITFTGDATGTAANATVALTLATTGVTAASYGNSGSVATFTVDAKGRITTAASTAIVFPVTSVGGSTGAVTGGTFSGTMVFQGTTTATATLPTGDNTTNVATTAFVHSTAANYLPLAGGTLTGALVATTATFTGVTVSGTTSLGTVTSSATLPLLDNTTNVATTSFVTTSVANKTANYLPLAGGTLTGALNGTSATFTSGTFTTATINGGTFSGGVFIGSGTFTTVTVSGLAAFNGQTTAVTQPLADKSTNVATTAFVLNQNYMVAPLVVSNDVTGTATGNTISLTLKNVGTAGTYSSVTTDANGRVIAGTNITVSGDATGTVNAAAGLPLTLATTGVSAGAYGSNTQVATFSVDTKGRITTATSVAINVVSALGYTPVNNAIVGVANGIATLDGSGKLTISQLPTSVTGAFVYKGTWDAFLNSPALANGVGVTGNVYKVSNAGTTNLQGTTQWNVGDEVVFDGTTWDKIDGLSNEVISVAGRTGVITLAVADITGAAPLASPALTGTPTAPTALATDNSTTIATTAFVKIQNYTVGPVVATGDATGTAVGNSIALTLATSGVTAGSYGSASQIPAITVDAKGRVTSLSNTTISVTGLLGYTPLNSANATVTLTGDATGSATFSGNAVSVATTLKNTGSVGTYTAVVTDAQGRVATGLNMTFTGDATGTAANATVALTLATTGVSAASYGNSGSVATFTVDAKGRITAASSTAIAFPVTSVGGSTGAVTGGTFSGTMVFQGTTTATAALPPGDNTSNVATTAFVHTNFLALTGGTLTGAVVGTTATFTGMTVSGTTSLGTVTSSASLPTNDNTTNVATTAFVHTTVGSYLPLVGGTLTGALTGTSATFASGTFTTATINAGAFANGAINNTTIGATTASTGAFTNLSATGTGTFANITVNTSFTITNGCTTAGIIDGGSF